MTVVSPGGYEKWKPVVRNKYMVDNSKFLIGYFDPTKTSGGTKHCIEYAEKTKLLTLNIWQIVNS
jgi:hypothetical protein